MKKLLVLLIVTGLFSMRSFSQDQDPLKNEKAAFKVKSKDEMARGEEKLTGKGKAAFEKAKSELKNVKDAKFELAPNEQLNQDPNELLGIPENEKPDVELAKSQNEENKKNQKEINDKVKKDSKNDKAELNFSASAAPPEGVGAAYSDAIFWYPAYYTPMKNQGGCGSCWSFAACAAFEHTYAKFYGSKIDLSEQDVLACGRTCANIDCGSCNGGWSDRAFDFMKCKGVASEAAYPYNIAAANSCLVKPKFKYAYTWGQLLVNNAFPSKEWVKYYITLYGSVVSYMKAGLSTFYSYGGGVYNGYPSNTTNNIDHAVVIVGWSDYAKAWIIKNSWGTGWGPYGGYAYVGYDQCNIAKYVYWVYPKQ